MLKANKENLAYFNKTNFQKKSQTVGAWIWHCGNIPWEKAHSQMESGERRELCVRTNPEANVAQAGRLNGIIGWPGLCTEHAHAGLQTPLAQ